MFRIKFEENKYQIHTTHFGAFEGSLESITQKAIEMGLDQNELTTAYRVMAENKHTVAEFGVNGYFICTHSGRVAC